MMKRVGMALVILVGLMVMSAATAVGLQNVPGPNDGNEWPFGNDPRDAFDYVPSSDFVFTVGSTVLTPGSVVIELGTRFGFDPFFSRGQTDIVVLPTFAANQSLETGLELNWWSATVDVDLALSPWALVSTGGWLELHPPEWIILSNPTVALEGTVGWGPRWAPIGDWSHTIAGTLDAFAVWSLPTLWDSSLDLVVESIFNATWALPNGVFLADWMFTIDALSVLPLLQNSPAALRAGVEAQIFVLPSVGFGFDVILEFRANGFYAYGLIGAGAAGINAEAGVEITFGLNLFAGLEQAAD